MIGDRGACIKILLFPYQNFNLITGPDFIGGIGLSERLRVISGNLPSGIVFIKLVRRAACTYRSRNKEESADFKNVGLIHHSHLLEYLQLQGWLQQMCQDQKWILRMMFKEHLKAFL